MFAPAKIHPTSWFSCCIQVKVNHIVNILQSEKLTYRLADNVGNVDASTFGLFLLVCSLGISARQTHNLFKSRDDILLM
jgi:hypothetical protein